MASKLDKSSLLDTRRASIKKHDGKTRSLSPISDEVFDANAQAEFVELVYGYSTFKSAGQLPPEAGNAKCVQF